MLGLGNCRVRVQLMNAIVMNTLLYGGSIYACLGSSRVVLEQCNAVL